jgi:hypothetical protein
VKRRCRAIASVQYKSLMPLCYKYMMLSKYKSIMRIIYKFIMLQTSATHPTSARSRGGQERSFNARHPLPPRNARSWIAPYPDT